MFHFMFVYYTLSSVWVAEWPPFGKELPSRLTICSHCIMSICNIYFFPLLVLTLVLRDPYRSGFAMHVCVAGYGSIRDRPVSSFTL